MDYLYLKALHIVGVVAWFSGLFYLVRLFIYHTEALQSGEPKRSILHPQFTLMEKRLLYGICHPAMGATLLFGIILMISSQAWQNPWFHIKLFWVLLLVVYQIYCGRIFRALRAGQISFSSRSLRMLNEFATVLLFAIVFPAVTKDPFSSVWGLLGFAILAGLILIVLRLRRT